MAFRSGLWVSWMASTVVELAVPAAPGGGGVSIQGQPARHLDNLQDHVRIMGLLSLVDG